MSYGCYIYHSAVGRGFFGKWCKVFCYWFVNGTPTCTHTYKDLGVGVDRLSSLQSPEVLRLRHFVANLTIYSTTGCDCRVWSAISSAEVGTVFVHIRCETDSFTPRWWCLDVPVTLKASMLGRNDILSSINMKTFSNYKRTVYACELGW